LRAGGVEIEDAKVSDLEVGDIKQIAREQRCLFERGSNTEDEEKEY
jgi:hypothetical protein